MHWQQDHHIRRLRSMLLSRGGRHRWTPGVGRLERGTPELNLWVGESTREVLVCEPLLCYQHGPDLENPGQAPVPMPIFRREEGCVYECPR